VDGDCRLVSRNGHTYKRFANLAASIAERLKERRVVFDGELVCLDEYGRSRFYDLMFRRGEPFFYAFDLLWLDGEDLRPLPLIERKKRLRRLIRSQK
jgi:bifunctional non-homologous end joining protein LigD